MARSLRARLLAAIGVVAILSVALAVAIGAVLTRRAVERNTLRDLSAQADLLASREREALLPLGRIGSLQRWQEEQDVTIVPDLPLDGSSPYLTVEQAARVRSGGAVDGTVTVAGTRYFFAAREVQEKGFVLLRPTEVVASAWRPQLEGLLVGAAAAIVLAGLAAFLLARAIAQPVRRVADAAGALARDESPPRLPVHGSRELALLARSFNEMAEQLARARDAERSFLLSVSHELKTPLTAIRGYAEGLGEGMLPVGEAAETIRREAERLERLVRDLLDLGRMRKREFTVRREPIDLADVARDAVRRHEQQARAFGVALEAAGPASAPAIADAERVLQVISNLVENAIRLTPAGGRVRVAADGGAISVEDTGPGLAREDLPRAFERFYLYSRYGRERPVGSGLGLAIVKELTHGMGGTVEVDSEPGAGACFTVRLPTPAGASEPETQLAPTP
ncbi:MAG: HAMP domain-containing histidine kinase [Thermoleophilia bacterium]|nr:HAMP domain-containing histidine kinase [Thermoleophilia bacterium]